MIIKFSKTYNLIGKNVKKLRKKAGLTQLELANKTNKVDRSKISQIENGKEDFLLSTLLEISKALKVDIKILFEEKV